MEKIERKILRKDLDEKRWCEIEIKITTEKGVGGESTERLSIVGFEGRIVSPSVAAAEAVEFWKDLFEDKEELQNFKRRYPSCHTSLQAARKVVEVDGEYHGLDIHEINSDGVFVLESCGQIREDFEKWFPEVTDLLPFHLNDMHAECVHQAARGETWGAASSGVVCPECGWKLGAGWAVHPLPLWVITKVRMLEAV